MMKELVHLSARIPAILAAVLVIAVVTSCAFELEDGNPDVRPADLQLMFAVPNTTTPRTKTIDAISQTGSQNYFHGMQGIRLLPFSVNRKIAAGDARIGAIPQLDPLAADSNPATNYNFVYPLFSFIPLGTSAFLFYGYSPDNTVSPDDFGTAAFKLRNGSLIAQGIDGRNPAGISFSPDPMWTADGYPAEAATIAGYLTEIANTDFTLSFYDEGRSSYGEVTVYWNWDRGDYQPTGGDPNPDGGYMSVYNRFINAGSMTGISGRQAAALISSLYKIMSGWSDSNNSAQFRVHYYTDINCWADNQHHPLTCGAVHNALRDAIKAKIESLQTRGIITIGSSPDYPVAFTSTSLQDFPRTYGLPDGAIGVRWDDTANGSFEVVAQGTKGAIGKYCYPPRLWYYANTLIQTSTQSDNLDQYPPQESRYRSWSSVLANYNNETYVQPETKAVALVDPIQYGVALLTVNLNYITSNTLPDAAGDPVTIGTSDIFPLTAIFVGGQRRQKFDFTPDDSADDYVSYDSKLYTGNPTVFIKRGSGVAGSVSTLSLQTLPGESIYVALEFQNNGTESFQGRDGLVVPGASFYLIGELKLSDGSTDCVFLQDHVTSATMSVSTLANARNAIPNLSVPQLDLGVEVEIEWIQSTSTTVPLY